MTGARAALVARRERLALMVVPLGILAAGAVLVVQPRVSATLRLRADVSTLEARVATLAASLARVRQLPAADGRDSLRAFEQLVPVDDRAADVVEAIARLVLDPPDQEEARDLQVETGAPMTPGQSVRPPAGGSSPGATTAAAPDEATIDPRFALFPVALVYTPIAVTFQSTYDRLGRFLWTLRDLPTLVEVRSLEIVRALPLAQVRVVVHVFQRIAPGRGTTGDATLAAAGHARGPAPGHAARDGVQP